MTPFDRMDPEAYPLPHRFKYNSVSLRHAYRSYYAAGLSTNQATHSLFNASTGPQVVVPRMWSYKGYAGTPSITFTAVQGIVGSHLGAEFPIWAGERQPAAQHCYADTATAYTPQAFIANVGGQLLTGANMMPLFVLPPGWSLVAQSGTIASTVTFMWVWEELEIEQPELGSIGLYR